jgi:hypothetical protein
LGEDLDDKIAARIQRALAHFNKVALALALQKRQIHFATRCTLLYHDLRENARGAAQHDWHMA